MGQLDDLTGRRFGRLTVEFQAPSVKGRTRWACVCECGNRTTTDASRLKQGHTKSCGCLADEARREQLQAYRETGAHPGRRENGVASFNRLCIRYRAGAVERGISWELTSGECVELFQTPCYYCGAQPLQKATGKTYNGVFLYNGLDRVDNARGYQTGNVVACCKECNYSKRDRTAEDFLEWVRRVYHNRCD